MLGFPHSKKSNGQNILPKALSQKKRDKIHIKMVIILILQRIPRDILIHLILRGNLQ